MSPFPPRRYVDHFVEVYDRETNRVVQVRSYGHRLELRRSNGNGTDTVIALDVGDLKFCVRELAADVWTEKRPERAEPIRLVDSQIPDEEGAGNG